MEPQPSSCSKPLAALRPAPGTAVKVAGRARLLLGLIPAPHASRGSSLPDRFLPTAPDQFLLVTTLRPWLEIRAASSGLSYARRLLTSLSCLVPRGSALPQIPSPTFVAGWGGRGGRRTWLDWGRGMAMLQKLASTDGAGGGDKWRSGRLALLLLSAEC